MCWLHDTIHLATVTLQESRQFGGFVKGGPKLSLRPFLHQALQLSCTNQRVQIMQSASVACGWLVEETGVPCRITQVL